MARSGEQELPPEILRQRVHAAFESGEMDAEAVELTIA